LNRIAADEQLMPWQSIRMPNLQERRPPEEDLKEKSSSATKPPWPVRKRCPTLQIRFPGKPRTSALLEEFVILTSTFCSDLWSKK
jgi:hypothetical protein